MEPLSTAILPEGSLDPLEICSALETQCPGPLGGGASTQIILAHFKTTALQISGILLKAPVLCRGRDKESIQGDFASRDILISKYYRIVPFLV